MSEMQMSSITSIHVDGKWYEVVGTPCVYNQIELSDGVGYSTLPGRWFGITTADADGGELYFPVNAITGIKTKTPH